MLRASVVTAATSLVLALAALVNSSVTARGLGVEGRGLLGAALLLVAVSRGAGLIGLGDNYVRQYGLGTLGAGVLRILTLSSCVALACGALIAALGVPLTPLFGMWGLIGLTVLAAAVMTGGDLLIAISRVESRLVLFNQLRVLAPIMATSMVAAAFVAQSGLTVGLVLMLQATAGGLALAWSFRAVRRHLRHRVRDAAKTDSRESGRALGMRAFLRSSAGYQGIALFGLVLTHAHMYVVMTIAPLGAFGIYSAVYGLSRMVVPIQMAVGSAVFARSASMTDSTPLGPSSAALAAHRLTFPTMMIVAAAVAATGGWLVPLLLGSGFGAGSLAFSILMFEGVVGAAAFILGQHLMAAGQVRSVLVRNAISLLPILAAPFLLNAETAVTEMALLLLLSAFLRLVSTLWVFRKTHGLAAFSPVPTRGDLVPVRNFLGRAR